MWLNQQTFDAIQILVALAEAHPALTRASDVAAATGITLMNVQKTVHALGDTGLIAAVRGRNGGVRLDRGPETITLASIVRVFEPKDCPAGFLPWSMADARISDVIFRAHRGFFQPLEELTLAAILADVRRPDPRQPWRRGGDASAAAGTALRPAASPGA
jgi:Rrf2 family transcriptional regulator, nitric oxide-sensitive transcriptional repressor